MKNKKGFTLIELLAVIVILAIIALIAIPIILNMINNARKSAARSAALGYIDAIEYNNGFAQIEPDNYTLITGTDIKTSTINIKLKGKKPTKGTVTINTNGKVTSARVVFNGYWVEYNGKEATVTGKYTPGKVTITFNNGDTVLESRQINEGSTIGSFPNITLEENQELIGWYLDSEFNTVAETTTQVDDDISVYVKLTRTCGQFATDSWEKISKNSYPVGCDGKTITMDVNGDNINETYHIMVVNNSNCSNETSETACGMVYQFKDVLNITTISDKQMNLTETAMGGWPASKMYTYLNETIYNKLPSDLKGVIISTKTVSGHEKNSLNNYESTNDKLYLLSGKEVGFDLNFDTSKDETRKLDYYESGNGANAKRIKYLYGTETATNWWLRTADSNNTGVFFGVYTSGEHFSGSANGSHGVSPAFRVGINP